MKSSKKIEDASRKTWLASVGASESGVNNATELFDKLFVDGTALVNELVERGEQVESQLKGRVQQHLKVPPMIEEKISALKAKLGMRTESREQQLDRLSGKVDDLIEVVAKLAQIKAQEKAKAKPSAKAKPAAKPATAKKDTAEPAAKAPASKAKATPSKPAASKPASTKSTGSTRTRKTSTTTKSGTASRTTRKTPAKDAGSKSDA